MDGDDSGFDEKEGAFSDGFVAAVGTSHSDTEEEEEASAVNTSYDEEGAEDGTASEMDLLVPVAPRIQIADMSSILVPEQAEEDMRSGVWARSGKSRTTGLAVVITIHTVFTVWRALDDVVAIWTYCPLAVATLVAGCLLVVTAAVYLRYQTARTAAGLFAAWSTFCLLGRVCGYPLGPDMPSVVVGLVFGVSLCGWGEREFGLAVYTPMVVSSGLAIAGLVPPVEIAVVAIAAAVSYENSLALSGMERLLYIRGHVELPRVVTLVSHVHHVRGILSGMSRSTIAEGMYTSTVTDLPMITIVVVLSVTLVIAFGFTGGYIMSGLALLSIVTWYYMRKSYTLPLRQAFWRSLSDATGVDNEWVGEPAQDMQLLGAHFTSGVNTYNMWLVMIPVMVGMACAQLLTWSSWGAALVCMGCTVAVMARGRSRITMIVATLFPAVLALISGYLSTDIGGGWILVTAAGMAAVFLVWRDALDRLRSVVKLGTIIFDTAIAEDDNNAQFPSVNGGDGSGSGDWMEMGEPDYLVPSHGSGDKGSLKGTTASHSKPRRAAAV